MTNTSLIEHREAKRIGAIAARLQSDHDGEVINAGRMLVRGLAKHDLRVADVIERGLQPLPIHSGSYDPPRPEPVSPFKPHQRDAMRCLQVSLDHLWSKADRKFLRDMVRNRRCSEKQGAWLDALIDRGRRHEEKAHG